MRHGRLLKAGLVLIAISVLAYLALDSAYFRVQTVSVFGNQKVSTEEITALAGLANDSHFFSFRSGQVGSAVAKNPWIARVEVTRKIPGEVRITVKEREPIAVTPYHNGFLVLDDENYALDFVAVSDVRWHIITGWEQVTTVVGDRVESVEISAGVRCVLQLTPQISALLSEISADCRGDVTVFLLTGLRVSLGQADAQLAQKFSTLQSLMDDFSANKMDVAYVDLRYDKPVVKLVTGTPPTDSTEVKR